MRKRQNTTKREKDRARDKIYQKRLEFQKLRDFVNSLTEEQKQSGAYRDTVAFVHERLERKRLENIKYRESKLAYSRKKRDEKLKQRMQYDIIQKREVCDHALDEELANYHFDIFSFYDFASSCTFQGLFS